MKRIGVTGNYGMGKSAALDAFRELGAAVINTDEVVAELLEEGPVLERVRAAFGDRVFMPDGRIDKKALADIIFSDAERKKTLEGILHPLVFDRVEARIREMGEKLDELTGKRLATIHIIGGGSQHELLDQFTADATGRTVMAGPVEATALGNVLVQALALGDIDSIAEGREVIANSFALKTFEPRDSAAWDAAYARYLKLRA